MKMKRIFCLGLALLMLVAFVSCGSEESNALAGDEIYYDRAEEAEKPFDYTYSSSGSLSDGVTNSSSVSSDGDIEEKLIVTVTLRAQTKEYDTALGTLRASVTCFGGYEESFQSYGKSYSSSASYCRSASMTVRIPAAQLDAFLAEVGELVNVVSEQNSMSNATEEYYDLSARVSVLEEERKAYEAMLSKAVDVEEILIIKDRLYDVISEIEAAKSRMKVIDSRASYSTVHLSLEEVVDYSYITTPQTTFGSRISSAFSESWRDFANGCQDFAVWFVRAFPTLLVLAVIIGAGSAIAILSNRRLRKRLNKKKEEENK